MVDVGRGSSDWGGRSLGDIIENGRSTSTYSQEPADEETGRYDIGSNLLSRIKSEHKAAKRGKGKQKES